MTSHRKQAPWNANQEDHLRENLKLTSDGMTIREVAAALGLSPTRVAQIERSAMDKMRRAFGLYELIEPSHGIRRSKARTKKMESDK
jgi:sigma-70-like protein